MITINLAVVYGAELEEDSYRAVAGEDLTVSLRVTNSDGTVHGLTGKRVVLGWESTMGGAPERRTVAGDSTGVAEFVFTPTDTHALANRWARFEVFLESGTARDRIVGVSRVTFPNTITPIPTMVYAGSSASALTDVSTLTEIDDITGFPFSVTLSPVAQYCYVAWPKSWGAADATCNGFPAGFTAPSTIQIESVDYYLAKTTQPLTATDIDFDFVEDVT